MLLDPVWSLLEEHVFPVPSEERLFNPYRDRHPEVDVAEAPAIRRRNLRAYLARYTERPPLFLLLEAPGPWGCRFTGVPITSEAQLADPDFPLAGRPTNADGAPRGEYSAGIYWRVLQPYFPHFFTWNSVPLHPHQAGEPLTVRNPTSREVKAFTGVVEGFLEALRPRRVLAVGRKAEYALGQIGVEATYVRHPSQGGARRFEAGVTEAFRAMGL